MTTALPDKSALAAMLAKNTLFQGLPPEEILEIASAAHVFDVAPGDVLIHDGEVKDDIFFLLDGSVIGQMVAESGREIVFTEMQAGCHFGELAALDGMPRSITVSARTASRVARLSGAQFSRIMHENAIVAVNLARELAARIRTMNERLFGLVVHDVETRVRMHLLKLAQDQGALSDGGILAPAPTHEEMATYVGANREAVSRAIARLNKSGMIKASRKHIIFQDCDSLLEPAI